MTQVRCHHHLMRRCTSRRSNVAARLARRECRVSMYVSGSDVSGSDALDLLAVKRSRRCWPWRPSPTACLHGRSMPEPPPANGCHTCQWHLSPLRVPLQCTMHRIPCGAAQSGRSTSKTTHTHAQPHFSPRDRSLQYHQSVLTLQCSFHCIFFRLGDVSSLQRMV